MTPLISCQEISKAHGTRELFNDLSVALFPGNRVGLVGPNGAGKSTLLKILAGIESFDEGKVQSAKGVVVGYVPQQVEDLHGDVESVVMAEVEKLTGLSQQEQYTRTRQVLGSLGFVDLEQEASELSGGRKRRLTIARELVKEPDLLLLDEPTNHLDLDSILWLEKYLKRLSTPFICTSHDRVFLDAISNKIWEISHRYPNGIFVSEGGYSEFLEQRELFLAGQQQREAGLRSKMRREEEWLRRSPKARTTKSRSRIQEAARLKHELAQLKMRNKEGKADLELAGTGRQTKKLIEAKGVGKAMGGVPLFEGISFTLYRGQRLGLVGENGSGKSTLLKILGGELSADSGSVSYAEGLRINLFDQHREQLDLSKTLREGLSPGGDMVKVQGQSIHVNSWCERFLFDKDRLDLPMSRLSGGERARVLIARMMVQPADLLLLDEPTNDLDIETLELLEESLDEFPGAVILITHDRAMMDRVADNLLEVRTGARYDNTDAWLDSRSSAKEKRAKPKVAVERKARSGLTYNEQRELAGLERKIEKKEGEIALATEALESIAPEKLQEGCAAVSKKQTELDTLYSRWEELESKRSE